MIVRMVRMGLLLWPCCACGPEGADSLDGSAAGSGGDSDDVPTGVTMTGDATGGSAGEQTTDDPTTGTGGEPLSGRLVALGLARENGWRTVELDLATGELTVQASLPPEVAGILTGASAYDPATRRIYQLSALEYQVLVIDGDTGALVQRSSLEIEGLLSVLALEVTSDGALVAVIDGVGEGVWDVARIDPDTGIVTKLAALPPQEVVWVEASALDRTTDHLYQLVATGELLVIEAGSGVVLDSVTLALGEYANIRGVEVVAGGDLVGLGFVDDVDAPDVVRVDPASGAVKKLSTLSTLAFSQGMSAYDPTSDRVLFLDEFKEVFVVDAGSGELLGTVVAELPPTWLFNPEVVW